MLGSKWFVIVGACLAGIGVGLGAIGAHALPDYLASQQLTEATSEAVQVSGVQKKLENFEKAVRYQLYHALAIIVIGFSSSTADFRGLRIAAGWMVLGILLFCGGIYGTVFTPYPTHWIVPFGGVSFIVGWIWLAVSVLNIYPDEMLNR